MIIKKLFSVKKLSKYNNIINEINHKFTNPSHDYSKAYKKILISFYRSLNYEYMETFMKNKKFDEIKNIIELKGYKLIERENYNYLSFLKEFNDSNINFEILVKVKPTDVVEIENDYNDIMEFSESKDNNKYECIISNGVKLNKENITYDKFFTSNSVIKDTTNDPFNFSEHLKDILMYPFYILFNNKNSTKKVLYELYSLERKIYFEGIKIFDNWDRDTIIKNLNNKKIYFPKFENLSLNIQSSYKKIIEEEVVNDQILKEIEYLMLSYESIRYMEWLNKSLKLNLKIYDDKIIEDPYINLN